MTRPAERAAPAPPLGAFTRLAIGMAALGLAVGLVFPAFTGVMGVPAEYSRTPAFRAACVAAGLLLGAANWALARQVIGRRLRALAVRLQQVATSAKGLTAPGGTGTLPADLRLKVRSADDLGATATAFNGLLEALDHERRFRSVLRAANDVIAFVDAGGRVSFVSDSVTDVLGWQPEDVVGEVMRSLVHWDDVPVVDELTSPDSQGRTVVTVRAAHAAGGWRHLEISASDRRADPVVGALLLTARDVTDRLELQSQLEFQARHDQLTGLPNRSTVLEAGAAMLAASAPAGSLAVALMDLDRFKEINDTLGHGYGDRLLAEVGPRLRPLVREVDVLARLGGDEFAVLLPGVTASGARAAAQRLREAFAEPFVVDGLSLDVDVSIGVAVSAAPGPHDIHTLLRHADIAMYAAKEQHRGVEVYDPTTDTHDRSRLMLLSEFRRALADGQLVLHYQPQVGLPGGEVAGVEALLRWQHPTRGLLAPGQFLGAVEQTGLIEPLTALVLDQALAQVAAWSRQGLRVPVAVNLSARNLHRVELADRVLGALATHGVEPRMLRLELTETALMVEPRQAKEVLARLHAAGVGLSIDDFGTGYSSMTYLKQLDVEEIKVDRAFVADMVTSPESAVLVRSVIELGHDLGLTVVAEGAEDAATVAALTELRCDVVQGYFFARPLSAADTTAWLLASPGTGRGPLAGEVDDARPRVVR